MSDSKPQGPTCRRCGDELDIVIPSAPESPVPHAFEHETSKFTAAEGYEIRRAVDQSQKDMKCVDSCISRLESLLLDCRKARGQHKAFQKRHIPLLKSTHRLPNEIWTDIFKTVSALQLGPLPISYVFCSAAPRSAPLSLSHVCSQWRSMALNTPLLWSNIRFRVKATSFPSSKLNLLNMYLVRSSLHSLDVDFVMTDNDSDDYVGWESFPDGEKKAVMQALEILVTQSARWQNVHLLLPSEVFNSPIFPLRSTPKLRSLILATGDCITDRNAWNPVFITSSPNLDKVHLGNFVVSRECLLSMIPWTNMRSVNFGDINDDDSWGFSAGDILELIRSCPHLQDITFICYEDGSSVPALRHSALQSLHVHCRTVSPLACLTTPALTSLELDQVKYSGQEHLSSFLSPERSPNLKHLRLSDCDLDVVQHFHSLQISQIQHLELDFTSYIAYMDPSTTSDILQNLSGDGWINLTCLHSLALKLSYWNISSEDLVKITRLSNAIASIVGRFRTEARHTGGLQQLTVHVRSSALPDIALETFKYLKQIDCKGLSVTFDED